MRIRTFHAPETPLGPRLKKLLALAVTDDPAHAAELRRDFVGKLPVWLDLDAAPRSGETARAQRNAQRGIAGADLVTVATRGLWEKVRQSNHRVHLVPEPIVATSSSSGDTSLLVSPAIGFCGPASPFWDAELAINLATLNRSLAVHLGEEALLDPHDPRDRDLRRRQREPVPALPAALAGDQPPAQPALAPASRRRFLAAAAGRLFPVRRRSPHAHLVAAPAVGSLGGGGPDSDDPAG